MSDQTPFWEKPLPELTREEWEQLCDNCGKCCLIKLEDADTGAVAYTDIVCKLFDPHTCKCGQYAVRKKLVPDCVVITMENIDEIMYWMPPTCAYRLRAEGEPLPDWHPLLTGTYDSVRDAGHSMSGRTVFETEVDEDDYEEHLISYPE